MSTGSGGNAGATTTGSGMARTGMACSTTSCFGGAFARDARYTSVPNVALPSPVNAMAAIALMRSIESPPGENVTTAHQSWVRNATHARHDDVVIATSSTLFLR